MRISDWSSDGCSSDLGQLGDDAGEPLILGGGIEEQATQDDLAAGIEATAFGGDPGVERIEASLGLGKTFFRQFDRFGSGGRSEEHTSELQSLMRISYAVFCLKKKKQQRTR